MKEKVVSSILVVIIIICLVVFYNLSLNGTQGLFLEKMSLNLKSSTISGFYPMVVLLVATVLIAFFIPSKKEEKK